MLYIKKIVEQDIKKELAFQFGPSADFFHMNCNDTYAVKHRLSLVFETESDSLKAFNNHRIDTEIHYNSNKRECRVTSEVKNFIFNADKCNAQAGDLIVLKRSETTASEYQKTCDYVKIDIVKQGSNSFDFYQQILNTNTHSQRGFCCVTTDIELPEDNEKELNELSDAEKYENSDNELNVIFYGAPGTGKSTTADSILKKGGFKTFRTTFHPESDYYSFVGSYKPSTDLNGKITYTFVPQIFIKAYLYAWTNPDKKTCLNIEEINRGNCAQIFGDIFQLLDRKYQRGCSKYTIDIDTDCSEFIKQYFSGDDDKLRLYKERLCKYAEIGLDEFSFEKILLPPNLYIFATMNTSDQSLYPMDSAFKRRWAWKYIPIDYSAVKDVYIRLSEGNYSWECFLREVNSRITNITQSEDKQLGQYFIPVDKGFITENEFRDKVLFYLWNDIYKDEYGTASTIFRMTDADGNDIQLSFSSLFGDKSSLFLSGIMKTLGINILSNEASATNDTKIIDSPVPEVE